MRFTVEIDTGNAAFDPRDAEVARILEDLAARMRGMQAFGKEMGGDPVSLRDFNGNRVGEARYEESDDHGEAH